MKIKIAVTDACIFIDLHTLDLVNAFFQLQIEVHTTTLVYYELYVHQQEVLKAYETARMLRIHNIEEEDFLQMQSAAYPRSLSETDKSVLHIASKINACILSSDKTVRNCASRKDIEYHGMIWIFDKLVNESILTPQQAALKLTALVAGNFIFQNNKPLVAEVEKRLKSWQ